MTSTISHDSLSKVSSRSRDSENESRIDFSTKEIDVNPPIINIIGK